MENPTFWFQLASLVIGGAGAFVAIYSALSRRISANTKLLHEKIEKLKDDVKDNYVRRDDLVNAMQAISKDVGRIERSQENMTAKVDQMVTGMVPVLARVAEAAVVMAKEKERNHG